MSITKKILIIVILLSNNHLLAQVVENKFPETPHNPTDFEKKMSFVKLSDLELGKRLLDSKSSSWFSVLEEVKKRQTPYLINLASRNISLKGSIDVISYGDENTSPEMKFPIVKILINLNDRILVKKAINQAVIDNNISVKSKVILMRLMFRIDPIVNDAPEMFLKNLHKRSDKKIMEAIYNLAKDLEMSKEILN